VKTKRPAQYFWRRCAPVGASQGALATEERGGGRRWGTLKTPRRARLLLAAGIGLTLAVSSACLSTTSSSSSGKKLVYFIFNGYTPPYFAPMASGITAASKHYPGLDIKVIGANASSSDEISDLHTAVAAGAKAIILNPVDASVTTAAKQAASQGTPIITIDRDVSDPTARIAFIGDNDTMLGQQETTSCLKGLQASGLPKPWNTVVIEGTLGASTAVDRLAGTMSTLKPYIANKSVHVVLNQSANFDTGTAQSMMSSFLASKPSVQAVISGNDAMALGALSALKSNGIAAGKKTIVCGVDAQPESLNAIKAGTQYNTVTHSPYLEAFWAVEAMDNYLSSKTKPPASDPDGNVLIPQNLVTSANAGTVSAWGTPQTIPPLPYGKSKAFPAG
jgi:ABC-type sugar transport system substrate-binding protein